MDERIRSLLAEGEPVLGTWPVTWDEAIDLAGSGASGELVATPWRMLWTIGASDVPVAVSYADVRELHVGRTTLRLQWLIRIDTDDERRFTLGVPRRRARSLVERIEAGRSGATSPAARPPRWTADDAALRCPTCDHRLATRYSSCDRCAQPLDWDGAETVVAAYERSGGHQHYYGPPWEELADGFRRMLTEDVRLYLRTVAPLVVDVAADDLDVPDASRDGGGVAVVGITDNHLWWQPTRARHHVALMDLDAVVAWREDPSTSPGLADVLTLFRDEDSYVRLGAPDLPDGSEERELVREAMAILRDRLIRRETPRLGD